MMKNRIVIKSRTSRKDTMKQSQRRVKNTAIHHPAITTKRDITFTGEWKNTEITTCCSSMISVCPPLILFNKEAFEPDINVLDECDHVVENLAAGVDGLIFILVFPANDRAGMNTVIWLISDRRKLIRQ